MAVKNRNEYKKKWRKTAQSEESKIKEKQYNARYNIEHIKGKRKYPPYNEARWKSQIKLKFGFGALEKYEEFHKEGGGTCLICGNLPERRRLDLDHNHITGKVCGVLCPTCNTALGLLKADQKGIELFIGAIEYIRTHR
jgi:Recombination endonuclease VII